SLKKEARFRHETGLRIRCYVASDGLLRIFHFRRLDPLLAVFVGYDADDRSLFLVAAANIFVIFFLGAFVVEVVGYSLFAFLDLNRRGALRRFLKHALGA